MGILDTILACGTVATMMLIIYRSRSSKAGKSGKWSRLCYFPDRQVNFLLFKCGFAGKYLPSSPALAPGFSLQGAKAKGARHIWPSQSISE
jgi:hypothetical protein